MRDLPDGLPISALLRRASQFPTLVRGRNGNSEAHCHSMDPWNFDSDEVIFLMAAGIVAVAGTVIWYKRLITAPRLGERGAQRVILALTPPACIGALWAVLSLKAD